VEPFVTQVIAHALSPTGEANSAGVEAAVRKTLGPIAQNLTDATIRAYAANFSSRQLSDLLAFEAGPTGQAFVAKIPVLESELATAKTMAMVGGAPGSSTASEHISPQTRDLIHRLMRSQDFEARMRRYFDAFQADYQQIMTSMTSHRQLQSEADRTVADDRFVALAVDDGEHFYAANFSDAQLSGIAEWVKSDSGQAALSGVDLVHQAEIKELRAQLATRLPILGKRICEETRCTAEQRSAVDASLAKILVLTSQLSVP
jgi:hypothetical protein